ncbi:MAG TPA: AraC family transcriptional regulator [Polyangiaceae bacterium]|nr:AraC family transcriptional regulator [Polyangiaceae bacterium]
MELVIRAHRGRVVVMIEGDGEISLRASAPTQNATARDRVRDVRVERALAAVRADPNRRFTVRSLAKLAGASPSTFARLFVKSLGMTPKAWLVAERLARAERLLVETGAGLAEIAERTGYASEFAFSRAFKRRFGVAPGRFRRTASLAGAAIRCAA